jgi:general secretion pathway protein G
MTSLLAFLTRRLRRAAPAAAGASRVRARVPGFTFIEVLVVLIILTLITGIVGYNLLPRVGSAKVDATKIQIKSFASALDLYRLDNSSYPSTEQGLAALMRKPEVGVIPEKWRGPYLNGNNLPTDGWNHPFVFVSDGRAYTITSLGEDGVDGGTELNADISSANL